MSLREGILLELHERSYVSLPELAGTLEMLVTPELISCMWALKREKLVSWKIGYYIRLSARGAQSALKIQAERTPLEQAKLTTNP
ncbi:hypothetical protein LCGC14_0730920 [marine sediment metagenome]|uniref:Uncharacterized protein n=1 Tax=marine sediment metagenome TaxID=412755 RepID=A0A0F9TGY1_9ZZZZ